MEIARVRHSDVVHLARREGNGWVLLRRESDHPGADVLREALADGDDLSASGSHAVADADVMLLAPVARPSKLIAIGLNYADHVRESGGEVPDVPLLFAKTPNSIIGPGQPIRWSAERSSRVDYEAELAIVLGRRVDEESLEHDSADPLDAVFGYTCCNDVSARDAQFGDGQWVRGKSFDSFCPLGPWIVTTDEIPDPQRLAITCDVSGERLQESSTAEMIFGCAELVAYVGRHIRLEPGDVIATGTPRGVGFARDPARYLRDGDEVTVTIEGIGSLINPCIVD
ncbi:MAG: fumarylacetoacetate hydrolase family protein [Acidimicrobiia bacterium]|nr:fumarylacetoacetate hydrolase family protein [Acidimicrobiia bacterium]